MSALRARAIQTGGTWTQERFVPTIMVGKGRDEQKVIWTGEAVPYDGRSWDASERKEEARKVALQIAEARLVAMGKVLMELTDQLGRV